MEFKTISTKPNLRALALEGLINARLPKPQHAAMEPGLHLPSMRASLRRLRLRQPRAGAGDRGGSAGFTLVEVMLASGVGLVVLLAVMLLSLYSSRSFVAIANYVDMDEKSQLALDKLSKELRQGHRLTDLKPTSLTFLDATNNVVKFVYDSGERELIRIAGTNTKVFLTECDSLQFAKFQGTVISNTFDCYDPSYITNSKLIQVSWTCSRKILGAKLNTESVQSAKIVIRNKVNQ